MHIPSNYQIQFSVHYWLLKILINIDYKVHIIKDYGICYLSWEKELKNIIKIHLIKLNYLLMQFHYNNFL